VLLPAPMSPSDSNRKKAKKKAPSPRRDGREAAVQYLFSSDFRGEIDFSQGALDEFWELRQAKSFAQDFARDLVVGVGEHLTEIDSMIRETLENYAFQRLSVVDRNILRLGAYEVLFSEHIPPEAAINEAIEIAKRFGGEESPKFVNGILDRIHQRRKKD
jgi:N utilization substance protein B